MKVVSMKGEMVDFTRYLANNEKTVAVGNGNMNARGDQVGRGGQIIKGREEIAADYYKANPKAVKKVAIADLSSEVFASPADAWKEAVEDVKPKAPSKKKIEDTE